MDGDDFALQASTKHFPTRGVNQAETEVVVQGPKDAFTELMSVNVVLTRRRIRDTRLKVKRKKVGRRSKTDVALLYMEDLVRPELLQKIERQVDCLDLDHLPDSGYAEQLLEKRQYSPFPQLQMTERPDKTSSALLEGRVALLPDNTPYAILLPATLNTFFQAAEDYYDRWEIMSFIRLIRFVAAFLTVTLPGLYIAFAVYHPELLPTALALKVAATRETIPLSVIGEVLIMEIAFELLREAEFVCHPRQLYHWHCRRHYHRFGGSGCRDCQSDGCDCFRADGHLLLCDSECFDCFGSAHQQIRCNFLRGCVRAVRGLGGTAAASGASGKSHLLWHPVSVSLLFLLRQ